MGIISSHIFYFSCVISKKEKGATDSSCMVFQFTLCLAKWALLSAAHDSTEEMLICYHGEHFPQLLGDGGL